MIFDRIFRSDISTFSWIFFGFSLFHWIFGVHYLYVKIFSFKNNEADTNKSSYNDERIKFLSEYDRCNPITQQVASREYFQFLKCKTPCEFLTEKRGRVGSPSSRPSSTCFSIKSTSTPRRTSRATTLRSQRGTSRATKSRIPRRRTMKTTPMRRTLLAPIPWEARWADFQAVWRGCSEGSTSTSNKTHTECKQGDSCLTRRSEPAQNPGFGLDQNGPAPDLTMNLFNNMLKMQHQNRYMQSRFDGGDQNQGNAFAQDNLLTNAMLSTFG